MPLKTSNTFLFPVLHGSHATGILDCGDPLVSLIVCHEKRSAVYTRESTDDACNIEAHWAPQKILHQGVSVYVCYVVSRVVVCGVPVVGCGK